jgi:cell division protein FtsW
MLYAALSRSPVRMAPFDESLVRAVLALLAVGLVMVYSSSIAIAEASRLTGHQPHYYLVRHAAFLGVAVLAGFVAFQVPLRAWQQSAPWLFMFGAFLLLVVLIPGVGREVNGSQRWLRFLGAGIQPSELVKLFAVLYAADYTVRKAAFMGSFRKGFLPMFGVMMFTGTLLLMEPDFGAFVVITTIAMGVLFLGGMNWRLFATLFVLLLVGFVLLIWISPYRMQRIAVLLDPWSDPFGAGYQLSHALIAFGRGEWFGVGLGASVEKLLYLPEAHTDFLLAVIGEELGFAGVAAVLALIAWVVARAFAIGAQAARLERYYPALVAQGVGLWIGAQALINIGVNLGVLPTKGLTLPLLSFGGSGLVANLAGLAILLRVDFENRELMQGRAP